MFLAQGRKLPHGSFSSQSYLVLLAKSRWSRYVVNIFQIKAKVSKYHLFLFV